MKTLKKEFFQVNKCVWIVLTLGGIQEGFFNLVQIKHLCKKAIYVNF